MVFVMLITLIVGIGMNGAVSTITSRSPATEMKNLAALVPSEVFISLITQELAGDSFMPLPIEADKISTFVLTSIGFVKQNNAIALNQDMPAQDASTTTPVDIVASEPINQEPPQPVVAKATEESPNIHSKESEILIYHSHNQESWLPELKEVTKASLAFDSNINVTLLGQRLQLNLKQANINTIHSKMNYPEAIKNFEYPKSYVYSKITVKEALAVNPKIKYLFDIHRDSQGRSETTIKVKDQYYAQVYFVIGEKNPNWDQNYEFANDIHEKLNEKVPGISKGIYNKNGNGNGEYNQSLSPYSSLIEIGGVENTLDESYRTIDVLGEVISELYKEAESVTSDGSAN